jgi:malate dehydrogenase
MRKKIALIGGGQIGGTLAHLIGLKKLGDVVLLDLNSDFAQGKSLDIMQSSAIDIHDCKIVGTDQYSEISGADVVIITAGIPRKPGMSRDDLIQTNLEVMQTAASQIAKYAPNAFVIVVTNPLDAMVYAFQKYSKLPAHKVVGMAGILDSARFKFFLSEALNISVQEISTFVLGGHGDTMVALLNYTSVAGIPLKTCIEMGMISQKTVDDIVERTVQGGAEIVKLLQNGSAYYAPASAAIDMAEAYLLNRRRILPCTVQLTGQYGHKDIYIGVPIILGASGVEKIIEIPLSKEEKEQFDNSVDSIRKLISGI